jgi:hypothetical protein
MGAWSAVPRCYRLAPSLDLRPADVVTHEESTARPLFPHFLFIPLHTTYQAACVYMLLKMTED